MVFKWFGKSFYHHKLNFFLIFYHPQYFPFHLQNNNINLFSSPLSFKNCQHHVWNKFPSIFLPLYLILGTWPRLGHKRGCNMWECLRPQAHPICVGECNEMTPKHSQVTSIMKAAVARVFHLWDKSESNKLSPNWAFNIPWKRS